METRVRMSSSSIKFWKAFNYDVPTRRSFQAIVMHLEKILLHLHLQSDIEPQSVIFPSSAEQDSGYLLFFT